jgi:uncharacterized protein YjbJ (UPF0337 family)
MRLPVAGYRNAWQQAYLLSTDERIRTMGTDDKIDNKAEEFQGKAKETVGKATDDEELEAEGQTDQAKSNVKQAGEKIKDVFKG